MKWCIDPIGRFYNPGEDMVVYFDTASGDTHLISEFAAYLIQQIADQPIDVEALIKRISPDIDPADLSELIEATPDVLEQLTTLDILKRV